MKSTVIEKIKGAPKEPGVYIFRGKAGVLYVGKAANLRNRLKSYSKIADLKTQSLHEEATDLSLIILRSEIEALIEESRLIKKLKPKYNVLWRDDKSYLYVYFTKEDSPKIFIGHAKPRGIKNQELGIRGRIGPFTDGAALRIVMKILRRYFPYCTCLPAGRPASGHLRDCLNAQIGKCLGFCCKKNQGKIAASPRDSEASRNDEREYRRNIKMIKAVLRGQSKKLFKTLTDEKERWALEKIFEHRPYILTEGIVSQKQRTFAPAAKVASPSAIYRSSQTENERTNLNRLRDVPTNQSLPPQNINRVECYDNSNFAGKEAVGAMTALVKKDGVWVSDKNSYRKFKIKFAPTRDDPRMMYEIVSRRLRHPEWPYPDLIIIDGGITQYHAALKAQSEVPEAKNIKITAYPKPQKILLGWPDAPEEIKKLAEQAIYQTHNFVIRYHRQVRNKQFLL